MFVFVWEFCICLCCLFVVVFICSLIMFANWFAVLGTLLVGGYLLLLLFSDLVCVCCFVLFVVF